MDLPSCVQPKGRRLPLFETSTSGLRFGAETDAKQSCPAAGTSSLSATLPTFRTNTNRSPSGPKTGNPAPFTTIPGDFQPSSGANTDTSPSLVTASRPSRGNQPASVPSKDAPNCPPLRTTESLSWRLRYASQRPNGENRGECNPSLETIFAARPSGNSRVQRLPASTHVNVPSKV